MNKPSIAIPDIFKQSFNGKPFSHCLICEKELIASGAHYIIEKAIRHYPRNNTEDVIFEYAMCVTCHEEIMRHYSQESLQAMRRFFAEHVDFRLRHNTMVDMAKSNTFATSDWIRNCLIKGTPIEHLREYQLGAECMGDQMILSGMPYIIGGPAIDELTMQLSNETIDQMRGYMDQFLGVPPELRKLLNDSGILIL
ncbi:MAG: hypothetical protein D6677_07280 [Calditrichaeota bacterium]|nr:MAG: hypothetical protein D6677_07280 [Calditrichota bacterium]